MSKNKGAKWLDNSMFASPVVVVAASMKKGNNPNTGKKNGANSNTGKKGTISFHFET